MNRFFPFHPFGLRGNPFRALTDEEWAEIVVLPDAAMGAASGTAHLQIIAARGRGKTSALLGLAAAFAREGKKAVYEYLAEGQSSFSAEARGLDVFLLDEAQRLSERELDKLLRLAASPGEKLRLALSSHVDLTPQFSRRGLPFVTVPLGSIAPAYLQKILDRRLRYFALGGSPTAQTTFAPDAADFLCQQFGGDLRSAERFLYEFFQRLEGGGMITAAQLREAAEAAATGPGAERR